MIIVITTVIRMIINHNSNNSGVDNLKGMKDHDHPRGGGLCDAAPYIHIYIYTYIHIYIYTYIHMVSMFSREWWVAFSDQVMSLRPFTTGVSAGSSLALALKLLNFDHRHLLDLYQSVEGPILPTFHSGSFLLGLICGLVLFGAIEWLVTLRWCLIQWVQTASSRETGTKKELYRLL